MSYQISFLQSEEDAEAFLDYMASVGIRFFHQGECVPADEMYDDVVDEMNYSYMHAYAIVPAASDEIDDKVLGAFTGVEYMICSKGNPQSRTYNIGRIYYRSDEDHPYNAQMIKLYKKLKAYIRKNYIYYKQTWAYCGPHFKEGYDEKKFIAAQLGGYSLKLL